MFSFPSLSVVTNGLLSSVLYPHPGPFSSVSCFSLVCLSCGVIKSVDWSSLSGWVGFSVSLDFESMGFFFLLVVDR